MSERLLWPARYAEPADLPLIEAVPLPERGLPATTYTLLARAARLWPERRALTVLREAARWREPLTRTFAELLADVHRYANVLHDLGTRRGDAVALMAPNCAELIGVTLAAQLAGVAAPLNGALSPDHLAHLVHRSGARVLVAAGPELSAEMWQTAQRLAADGALHTVLLLQPTGTADAAAEPPSLPGVRVRYLADLAAEADATGFRGEPPASADLAALLHTGGTTGTPKLAAHTHANQVANAWMLAANSQVEPDTALFAALPLFHVNALVVTLLTPLFKGQGVVWGGPLGYREPALYAEYWRIVEHYRIAAMSAVPTVYAVLARCPIDADISSLRFPMVGASPLPDAVRERFLAHAGVGLVEGYGLTEGTCASARSFPDAPRPGAVGQRLPYQRIKAVGIDSDGNWTDLPTGETGVLAISGPTVFAGYVTGSSRHGHLLDGLGKLADGWLDTGDIGRIDADGFVYLRGRVKDLIIRGGHNIDPAIIEDALLSHPQVTAAAAVGRPDAYAGEVPVAYVTLAPGASVTEAELCLWAAEHVAERAAAPKLVTVRDTLPQTSVGKPYKPALRADAARGELIDALAHEPAVRGVQTAVEDGAVVATVFAAAPIDEAAVKAVLGRYALAWTLTVAPS